MEFRVADTFTDSLARRTGDQQKVVLATTSAVGSYAMIQDGVSINDNGKVAFVAFESSS